jgi:ABC-type nitrate/sulfonate/bicarbonate transport system, permease component
MKKYTIAAYAGAILLFFSAWWLLAKAVSLPIIPLPELVLATLGRVFFQSIAIHGVYSLWRIMAGLFLAIAVGLPLGVLLGYFPKLDKVLSPVVYLTYPIPKIALLPIVMLLFGVGEAAKILLIFLIVVFQVIVAVRDGIRLIPAETYYPLNSLGASFYRIFCDILWPASLPKFITAVRVAMATAISVLFFTETFGTQFGLGYFIMDAWLRVNYLEMYAGIFVLSLMGLVLFGIIDLLERCFCSWQYK